MKALSVLAPWGKLIADQSKTIEVRSWYPRILPMRNVALVQNMVSLTKESAEDKEGYVVAIIDIVSCSSWEVEDCKDSGCDESEFEEGWLAWKLSNIRKLKQPVKAIAKRKFYDLSDAEEEAVKASFPEVSLVQI